jgi:hypothetical protein
MKRPKNRTKTAAWTSASASVGDNLEETINALRTFCIPALHQNAFARVTTYPKYRLSTLNRSWMIVEVHLDRLVGNLDGNAVHDPPTSVIERSVARN